MADILKINQTESVNIVGSDLTGNSTFPVAVDNNGNLFVKDTSSGSVTPGTVAINSSLIGGQYNLTLPTLTTGQQSAVQLDSNGRVLISSAPLPSTSSKFTFGDFTSASVAQFFAVERTTYTEQATNSSMMILSSSANDTAIGIGARTVTITYFDALMAGPFTTTFIMNGIVAVISSVSNICFVEKIMVTTAGTGLSNAGILTLKAGAITVGTINTGDNQTFWAHHYVPSGKTIYISGVSTGSNSNTSGGGGLFILKASTPTIANSIETQISDFITQYGQSSTNTRTYFSPIQFTGPCRVRAYVLPSQTSTQINRCSFDYIET